METSTFCVTLTASNDAARAFLESPWEITSSFKIGRGPQCDLVLDARTVSKEHCFIELTETNQVFLRDLQSRNGTMFDKQIIEPDTRVPLSEGVHLLRIAEHEFSIEVKRIQ